MRGRREAQSLVRLRTAALNDLPFGISQYTTWTLPFAEDVLLCGKLGVKNIEVCEAKVSAVEPDYQLRMLRDSGLKVSSVQPRYHSPFPNSLRKFPASPKERMRRLRETIRLFGRYFPGTTLVVNTGVAPGGNFALAQRVAVREFGAAAQYAEDHGVRLALESLNPVYMNTDTFICSLRRAAEMVETVNHRAFGLFLDLWHFWEEPDAPKLIRDAAKIFGVHVSDWRRPRAFADRHLPGDGEIPIVDLLRTIRKAGYDGIYTLEVFSDLKLADSLWKDPARTVADGRASFRRIWRKTCA
ncbi:MAG: 4-hydroxyphenylpyruvate dioxygenase [Verrucomicrobia bacterium]|nr:4-hydroxyphenylpyruvate dioxygenase [Verrucomicrobiota bacterium]